MSQAVADPRSEEGSETDESIPRRRRRKLFTPLSAGLFALVTCAAGFYGGVRVEKGQISSTPRTLAAATAGGAASGTGRTARSAAAGGATGGAGGFGGFAGARGAAGAGGAAGANASFGTVASVNGTSFVLTESSGDTVKVTLSSATKISKSESVGRGSVHPGDTITVSGVTTKQGTISAATVTDSGAGGTGSRTSSGTSSSGSASSGSGGGVSSLFGG